MRHRYYKKKDTYLKNTLGEVPYIKGRNIVSYFSDLEGISQEEFKKNYNLECIRSPISKLNGKNFIFIHINKTGGTSISNALGIGKTHQNYIKTIIPLIGEKKLKNTYTFTCIRNPFERILSQYNYRIKPNKNYKEPYLKENVDFNKWVKLTYKEKNKKYWNCSVIFKPQIDWVKDNKGKVILPNKIIRFEKIKEDFNEVTSYLEADITLPHLNKSTDKKQNYREKYNSESKKIIEEYFKEDLEYFNYKF
jgi:hypothetical protein